MTAERSVLPGLEHLLRLQDRDLALDRLRHRREHLPAHAELMVIKDEAGRLRQVIEELIARRDEAAGQQSGLQAEVSAANRRIKEINIRLYGPTPVGPKDAQAMSEEVAHLEARRNGLEDHELEIMEILEPLEIELEQREGEAEALADRARAAMAELSGDQAEIDGQIAALQSEREALATTTDGDLLREYERLRPQSGGVGVARLTGASCGGCHLTLSAREVNQVRQSLDRISHCEECGRILVP